MVGEDGFRRLRQALVVVVGLGGVGSHAAMALARVGVGRLRLVDCDRITATSLNRHATATPEDVGRLKTAVVRDAVQKVRDDVEVECLPLFTDEETVDATLAGPPSWVVDAIDSLGPKVFLLAACVGRSLPVVSSMGASARTDPSQVRIADLSRSAVCPLARRVRQRLRRLGIDRGITAVYSTEEARAPLPPEHDEGGVWRGRVRNRQPSLSTLPGIFGYAAASAVIRGLVSGGGAVQDGTGEKAASPASPR